MRPPAPLRSIALPVRFDGRDLVCATGADLRQSQARHLLLTEPGELPWRTDFGAGLGRLRHRRLDTVLVELARIDVRNAFRQWLPAVTVVALEAVSDGEQLVLRVPLMEISNGQTTTAEVTP
jgi:phage baseplate assembly protein W